MYYLGIDLGSSSVKVALVEKITGRSVAVVNEPEKEMDMLALHSGWAEQRPEDWWKHVCKGIGKIKKQCNISSDQIHGIGISYQMHGLVLLDKEGKALRNSIIWCDSRAVGIGKQAFEELGTERCFTHLLNSPANFTASKLKWVRDNEPEIYNRTHKFMLPGDYIAYRFSGKMQTTLSGLSEGIFWDFKENGIADFLLSYYGIDKKLIPELVPTFGNAVRSFSCRRG